MTNTAVIVGTPPIFEEIPMAIGVVIEYGIMLEINDLFKWTSHEILKAAMIDIIEPKKTLNKISLKYFFKMGKKRYNGMASATVAGCNSFVSHFAPSL